MKKSLLETLRERRLVCDGAMGTQLMLAGLANGECGEAWNLSHPGRVLKIQQNYVEAGADCLITNTFGGSRLMLSRHGHGDSLRAINQAGARLAREAFGGNEGFVLGDLGPLGAILEPFGDLSQDEARAAYEEQARALVEAGVDAIIIETQTSLDELGVAIDAAKSAGAPCIVASLAYDLSQDQTFYVTMMGAKPEEAAKFAEERGANIIALNCGTGMDMNGAAHVAKHIPRELPLASNGAAQCRSAGAGKHEGRLQTTSRGHGEICAERTGRRREHHRFLLRQHAGPHAGDSGRRGKIQPRGVVAQASCLCVSKQLLPQRGAAATKKVHKETRKPGTLL